MSTLICDIVTPAEKLYSEEAYMVIVPGIEGEMGFLPNHEPTVTVLADGIVRIQPEKDGTMLHFVVQGGYAEVTGKKVIILADRACSAADIDVAAVREQLSAFEAKLSQLSEEEAKKTPLESDISWCKAQIHAVEK